MRELRVVDASDPSAVMDAVRAALSEDGPAVFPSDSATPSGSGGPPPMVHDDIALVVATSGSSGRPKRVGLSADAVLAGSAASDEALGGSGQWLLALPVHYIAGINVLARSLLAGTAPVMLDSARFDARAFVDSASTMTARRRFTSLVPIQLARVVALAETDDHARDIVCGFDRILVGGQATPAALIARAGDLGLNVTRTYGSSETCGGCVYDGAPLSTTRVRILDGEVLLGGPMLATEYVGDAERTADAFVSDGDIRWYRTGDSGRLDDEQRLTVTGRRDRVIISGGVKVSLDEVESLARAVPGHESAVAVRSIDAEWGEAYLLVTDGRAELPADIFATLGRAGRPKRIVPVESIPLLASGKPDRVALADLAGDGL